MLLYTIIILLIFLLIWATEKNKKEKNNAENTVENTSGMKRRDKIKLLSGRRAATAGSLFNSHFLDVKVFYIVEFNRVPSVQFIGDLNVTEAYQYILETYKNDISGTYQHCYFDQAQQKNFFNTTVFVLNGDRLIELGNNYCHLLYGPESYAWTDRLVKKLAEFCISNQSSNHVQVLGFARQPEMN